MVTGTLWKPYVIWKDFPDFLIFDALWTIGMSKQVNNITLHIANHSKLPIGCFKNKKRIDIINIWVVPKFGFVPNNHENFLPRVPMSFTYGLGVSWLGIGKCGEFTDFRCTLDHWAV